MNIKGMSIQDIMSMSWKEMKSLNERELKALSQRLNSAANKRLRRIEKSGEANWSPAYQHIKKSGGDFSVKGKGDKISLMNEIQRASGFLQAETGSVEGIKRYKKKVKKVFNKGYKKLKKEVKEIKKEVKKYLKKKKRKKSQSLKSYSQAPENKLYKALEMIKNEYPDQFDDIGDDVIYQELKDLQDKDKRISAKRLAEYFKKHITEIEKKAPDYASEELDFDSMSEMQKKKLYRALDRLREKNAAQVHNIGSDVIISELRRTQLNDKRISRDKLVEELEKKFPELMESSEERYEREQDEIRTRTDEDGIFRKMSPEEEEDSPFKR